MTNKTILRKIFQNIVCGVITSFILTELLPDPISTNFWRCFISLFIIIFSFASFYGDEPFNVTSNWPQWLKNLKNVIGVIGAIIFFSGMLMLIHTLIVM